MHLHTREKEGRNGPFCMLHGMEKASDRQIRHATPTEQFVGEELIPVQAGAMLSVCHAVQMQQHVLHAMLP